MEKPIWYPGQIRAILLTVPSSVRALFICIALTGLRLGEILALQWRHVDLEERFLDVEQALWKGRLISPKTAGSVRKIPFGSILHAVLLEHRQGSTGATRGDFLFCGHNGAPLNPDVLRKDYLYPALDRNRIARPLKASGFYTFRHSAASFINARTGNLKLAQRFLGHAQLSTTVDVYTHTSTEAERSAAVELERAIFGNLFPTVPNSGNGNNSVVN